MSSPQSIVVSLDWAKNTAQVGLPQDDALFYWCYRTNCKEWLTVDARTRKSWLESEPKMKNYAAWTAEELLETFPLTIRKVECYPAEATPEDGIRTIEGHLQINRSPDSNLWEIYFARFSGPTLDELLVLTANSSLANAAASMACYLVEQSLLSFKHD